MHGMVARQKYLNAASHSRWVRRFRWLLPSLIGVAVLAFLAFAVARSFLGGVSLSSIRLDGTSLVMDHPHLTGYDSNRRPYALVAERARQNISAPNKIYLEKLDARIELAGNHEARVIAENGFFDGSTNIFRAEGNVRVTTTLGYELLMKSANVYVKTSSMTSDEAVEVRNGENRVFADTMSLTNGGERIVFEGRVRTIFVPPEGQ